MDYAVQFSRDMLITLLVVRKPTYTSFGKKGNLLVHATENSSTPGMIAISRGWIGVLKTL